MVIVRIVLGGVCIGLAVFFVMMFLSPPLPFHHPWCATNYNDATNLIIAAILLWIGKMIIRHIKEGHVILLCIILCMNVTAFLIFPHTHGSIAANEASAIASLKILAQQETIWCQNDVDGNGINDYWTADISCFNRFLRSDGSKVIYIDISLAKADVAASSRTISNPFITDPDRPDVEVWLPTNQTVTVTSKSGYLFRAMLRDENGVPYNQNPVGKNGIKACNSNKFAFVAYPHVYATSGLNTFIINENGTVYQTDAGTDGDAKIVLQWPGKKPTEVKGPGGKLWAPAE